MPKDQADANSSLQSRRGFLARMGIGAAAIAAAASLPINPFRKGGSSSDNPFPGKGSAFHPAQDPRLDPRRNKAD